MSNATINNKFRFPWLSKPWIDMLFILFPPFIVVLFIFLFPEQFNNAKELPVYWWVILVLLIDVAHVYSTLFRTYLSKNAWQQYRSQMIWMPIAAFAFSFILCQLSISLFWTVLAYIAVFHFIRQQYGILRLYNRNDNSLPNWSKKIDEITIYASTLYPIIYWHLSTDRNFNWFVENDFLVVEMPNWRSFVSILYYVMGLMYVLKTIYVFVKFNTLNVLALLVVLGTALSWYLGIIYFNGDLVFTMLNVISHGIPYMALVWIVSKREQSHNITKSIFWKRLFSPMGILIFLGIIFLLAYVEEGLWDVWVWHDNFRVFKFFEFLNFENISDFSLKLIIATLTVPQLTHYIIDGVIWRKQK